MLAVKAQWGSMGMPDGVFSQQEGRYGIHGGDVETSLMLALNPETVDMSAARDFRSLAEAAVIPPTGPVSLGWVASDLNPAGVVGEAHLATAEKGEATIRFVLDRTIELLRQVEALTLDGYAPVTGPA
jgi:creatinine amidohydrolase